MSLAWGLGSSPGGEFAALSNRSASAFRLLRELGLIEKPFFLLPLPAPPPLAAAPADIGTKESLRPSLYLCPPPASAPSRPE